MLMGIMPPGWDSRNAVNFLDQLTEWERRIQECEGESLVTFSDSIKIAVLASHAPEHVRAISSDVQQDESSNKIGALREQKSGILGQIWLRVAERILKERNKLIAGFADSERANPEVSVYTKKEEKTRVSC